MLASHRSCSGYRNYSTYVSTKLEIAALGVAPSVLAGLIGDDVLHKWYYMPIVYGVYGAAAMLSLFFIRETRDLRVQDLDQEARALVTGVVPEVRAERALD